MSTEPPPIELDNVRFLAGYRRAELIDRKLLNELGLVDLNGLTLGEAVRAHGRHPEPMVRSAVLHLLWQQVYTVDLTRPLARGSLLRRTA